MTGRHTRLGEITVDSDFATTTMLAVLFLVLILMLARDIRHILWTTHNDIAIAGTLNRISVGLALVCCVYCLLFESRLWPNGLVKIGCTLLAAHWSFQLVVTYFRISPTPRSTLTFAGLVTLQASLMIFLVAIADWFRRVVRWDPASRGE
jgi:hypothetical protein